MPGGKQSTIAQDELRIDCKPHRLSSGVNDGTQGLCIQSKQFLHRIAKDAFTLSLSRSANTGRSDSLARSIDAPRESVRIRHVSIRLVRTCPRRC